MNITWPRRKPRVSEVLDEAPSRVQATVLINLGLALRSIQEGNTLSAIFHLSKAMDAISTLMERLSEDPETVAEELL